MILVRLLTSKLFLLGAFVAVLIGVAHLLSWFDSRDIRQGDELLPNFKVIVALNRRELLIRDLNEHQRLGLKSNESLNLPNANLPFSNLDPAEKVSLQIQPSSGGTLIVKLTYSDPDKTIWEQYEVSGETVRPLRQRYFSFDYVYAAMPYAAAFTLLLLVSGSVLRKMQSK